MFYILYPFVTYLLIHPSIFFVYNILLLPGCDYASSEYFYWYFKKLILPIYYKMFMVVPFYNFCRYY
jgi:hypothetical protein